MLASRQVLSSFVRLGKGRGSVHCEQVVNSTVIAGESIVPRFSHMY